MDDDHSKRQERLLAHGIVSKPNCSEMTTPLPQQTLSCHSPFGLNQWGLWWTDFSENTQTATSAKGTVEVRFESENTVEVGRDWRNLVSQNQSELVGHETDLADLELWSYSIGMLTGSPAGEGLPRDCCALIHLWLQAVCSHNYILTIVHS